MITHVRNAVAKFRHSYTITPVTTAAWVTIIASNEEPCSGVEIFDSSGSIMKLATGTVGNEVELPFHIFPGGNNSFMLHHEIPSGVRISAKAVDASATAGDLCFNFYG